MKSGDNVLFERGGVYREKIELVSGVTYGAYGTGDKPAIYGSPKNYIDWTKTDTPNVWICDDKVKTDIGTIVFDHGWAAGRRKFTDTSKLAKNFDFYQNKNTGDVYLYLECDPSQVFSDIEFCVDGNILNGDLFISNVTIDNLCIKYGGGHGIAFEYGSNQITITNCEIAWIGGSLQSGEGQDLDLPEDDKHKHTSVRYGNGIEFWQAASKITVKNNWIYQIYDAGITNQASGELGFGYTQSNINYDGNLIEYCTYGIEYFQATKFDTWEKITYQNNIIRFSGYGWGQVRPNAWAVSAICGWGDDSGQNKRPYFKATDFVIQNNTFDSSSHWTIMHYYPQEDANVQFKGNNYYVTRPIDLEFAYWISNGEKSPGRFWPETIVGLTKAVQFIEGEYQTGHVEYLQ